MKQILQVDGDAVSVSFQRRRYGRKTFCWAYFTMDGQVYSVGDPYPAINFPRKLLAEAIRGYKQCPESFCRLTL